MSEAENDFNRVLLEVIRVIEKESGTADGLSDAMRLVRESFSFGSAFIYEYDPSQCFVLEEHSTVNGRDDLPARFRLEDHLSAAQVALITERPLLYTGMEEAETELQLALSRLFAMQSLFVVFIVDEADGIIGCVGIADKRAHPRLERPLVSQANTMLGVVVNAAKLRIYKRRLEYTRSTLESIMDHAGFDIYVNDYDTHEMLYANRSMAEPYGGWQNMKGKTCHQALYDGQEEECAYCPKHRIIDEAGNPSKVYSWDYQRPFDGKWFRVISAAFRWVDGRLAQVISSADIDEAKRNEQLIEHMAFYDMLTGIPNRRKFENDLVELLSRLDEFESGVAILFLDLDNFKEVNDTYGHNTGDALLKHVAESFQNHPLTAGRCYRYAGDEFIFVYADMVQAEAKRKAEEITGILGMPFELNGSEFVCDGSVGFAHCPEDGTDYWTILDKADSDMYANKNKAR